MTIVTLYTHTTKYANDLKQMEKNSSDMIISYYEK
jgi:hypothetical protein